MINPTPEEETLWLEFTKIALSGNRMAHPDETPEQVAMRAFDDALAMMHEFQRRVG